MGISENHPAILQAIEKGLIRSDAGIPASLPVEKVPESRKPELVAPSFSPPGTWVLPIVTASEANGRQWRERSNRTQAARKIVSEAFGRSLVWVAGFAHCYHACGALKITFTRLGGKQLDRSNLPTALKATEDAVALMLGADDGDPRWLPSWEQEPGGPAGVRIQLSPIGRES